VHLKPEVLDRLLLSKSFLDRIRFQPIAEHDGHTLAVNIIAAHDSAEFAIAAIADQLGCSPPNAAKTYLMDYFDPIEKATNKLPHGKDYIRQLNTVRSSLKHQGLRPNAKQWAYVAEKVFETAENWCSDYLQVSFADLDESELSRNADVKQLFKEAQDSCAATQYREALEKLGIALAIVLHDNVALHSVTAGEPRSEDAIRLSGFAVHANDFLALQEFLPHVPRFGQKAGTPVWKQSVFGHPGNWRPDTVEFCLRTFIDVAIKIQDAAWRPKAIERMFLYDQQLEALKDGVEIWKDEPKSSVGGVRPIMIPGFGEQERKVVATLRQGARLKGVISMAKPDSPFFGHFGRGSVSTGEILEIWNTDGYYGMVLGSDVRVTCVPIEHDTIREFYPDLPVLDWDPE